MTFNRVGKWLIKLLCCFIGLWAVLPERFSFASADPLTLSCDSEVLRVQCYFRPLIPITVQKLEVIIDEMTAQPVTDWQPFMPSQAESAILWLVDVSNPGREATVGRQRELLRKWLAETRIATQHRLGLAIFANKLQVVAPLGSTSAVVEAALEKVTAQGQSTAFYRSLLDGINFLDRVESKRKSLWVFSDGMAEDTAYSHDDVVKAARSGGINIIGLGYPERESQRPALQRLQRLAEETGGYFVAATAQSLAPSALEDILTVVDGGGRFSLELAHLYGQHRLSLRLLTPNDRIYQKVLPIHRPSPGPDAVTSKTKAQPAETAKSIDWLPWLSWGGGAGVLALLSGLLLKRYKTPLKPLALARFEFMDSGELFAICAPLCRIGRAQDNDLCLQNDSVSAYHAELQQRRDGSFSISDLGSTNGVWVNGKQVNSHRLRNGDVLEFGDVYLRFLQNSEKLKDV